MTISTLELHPLTLPTRFVPLTVEQYQQMIRKGILKEGAPIELIDGLLVPKDRSKRGGDPMSIGEEHASVVDKLGAINKTLPDGYYVRLQQPIAIQPNSAPEPDGALVRGEPDDYAKRHPSPADVLVIFEVADSSLQLDQTTKLRLYADAGIGRYVLINLIDRVIDDMSDPVVGEGRHAKATRLSPGENFTIRLDTGETIEIPVARFVK